jgi:hypothetical protein
MKRLLAIATAIPALALMASAQEENGQFRVMKDDNGQIRMMKMEAERVAAQAKIVSIRSAVMTRTVKDAPYSATEITETSQTLGDGTRIHNETQAQVYRDSEGRTRRETSDQITIFDPVAKVSYILNPKDLTARQLPMGGGVFYLSQNGKPGTFSMKLPPPSPDLPRMKVEKDVAEKGAIDSQVMTRTIMTADGGPVTIGAGPGAPGPMAATNRMWIDNKEIAAGTPESLGTQDIGGVTATGTRITTTIPLNAIGNDRPLQIVDERWYSQDLQMVVQSKLSDPRTGEETFHLSNISRVEPPAYLFVVPSNYQLLK